MNDGPQAAGDQIRLDTHIEQSTNRAGGAARVESANYQMASQRRLKNGFHSLGVADFADENDLRVLTHQRSQSSSQGERGRRLYLRLTHAVDRYLDWVLERDDAPPSDGRSHDVPQTSIGCCCLAAPGGTCQQYRAA